MGSDRRDSGGYKVPGRATPPTGCANEHFHIRPRLREFSESESAFCGAVHRLQSTSSAARGISSAIDTVRNSILLASLSDLGYYEVEQASLTAVG